MAKPRVCPKCNGPIKPGALPQIEDSRKLPARKLKRKQPIVEHRPGCFCESFDPAI